MRVRHSNRSISFKPPFVAVLAVTADRSHTIQTICIMFSDLRAFEGNGKRR